VYYICRVALAGGSACRAAAGLAHARAPPPPPLVYVLRVPSSLAMPLDCVHRIPLPSPSPITVAPIGATVDRYPLHRIPLPPPLPSRFLLSPTKWMGTLPRSPPPRPVASQRSARDRNTPSSDLQAIQPRPQRRRRR
jgi:hypothetical protein